MKAVFLDAEGLNDLILTELEKECSSLQLFNTTPADKVLERIAGAEIIILNKVKITRQHLEKNPSVRLLCVVATGTDVVDLKSASDLGVTVCNCQAYGVDSVVQHVFGAMLALHTNLLAYHSAVEAGRWQTSSQFCFLDYPILEMKGKTLGIVGYGTLGRGIATIAQAFGMNVVIARRPGNPPDNRPPLVEMLAEVDILTLHCPLTDQTRNLIDAEIFTLMKPTSFLINCARGGLVDEEALVQALKTKKIAGAAVDVLSVEPPVHSNPLLNARLPNLIITPHIAWASREARQRIIDQTVENIQGFKTDTPLRTV